MTRRTTPRLLLSVIVATCGTAFQFGFSTGFTNNSASYIHHYFITNGLDTDSDPKHFDAMWAIVVSSFALGGIIGASVFPSVCDSIGRRNGILVATIPCFISSILIGCPRGYLDLIIGRALIGICAGGGCAAVPMYVAEISPKEVRGLLGTGHQLVITFGIVISQAMSTAKFGLLGSNDMWQWMMVFPVVSSLICLMILPLCGESPSWLYQRYGRERAAQELRWFRGDVAEIETELDEMAEEVALANGRSTGLTLLSIWADPTLRKPVLVGCMVNMTMQLSGVGAVTYYSTNIFMDANMSLEWAEVYTTMVGLINFMVTIPAMMYMDTAGRKVMQCLGLVGMCLSYVLITVALVADIPNLAIASTCFIMISFTFGPGCVTWFVISELIPIHARGVAVALGLGLNWAASGLMALIFPQLLAWLGPWTFTVFILLTAAFCLATYLYLPETKGRTPKEIADFFSPKLSKSLLYKHHLSCAIAS